MTIRPTTIPIGLALVLGLGLAAGCDSPKKAKPGAQESRETIGKTTQNVLKLSDALADGGVLATTNIEVADPLTQAASAKRTLTGKVGAMGVEYRINIRNASSIADPKPLSYDEFMTEIVKKGTPDALPLGMLPYYQEYAWDEANQKLVVVEFPARKKAYQKNFDEKLGRR